MQLIAILGIPYFKRNFDPFATLAGNPRAESEMRIFVLGNVAYRIARFEGKIERLKRRGPFSEGFGKGVARALLGSCNASAAYVNVNSWKQTRPYPQ
ncbi:MAG: hypothetical protein DBX55_04995 [Verrucomicrobia bacterium]|nr:MAG: hypothetical protein DBX55_04995 [Verrucomicrobiota bacterium]